MAIGIPGITGQKELVIKGLGTHLGAVPGIAGAAVMGDGSIVPVLSIPDLIEIGRKDETDGLGALVLDIPQTCTVMIVDDSISIRRVMSRLVTANGWIPVEAKDGLDAIEQLAEVRPDCIVLDIEMPRMNGFEFLTKVANLPMAREIPVIMLTSRASDKHRQKALQLGASAFLTKPCRDEEFVATVVRLTETSTGLQSHAGAGGVLA
jgi:chemosensory pili system protein ChpA (sensor histidine kinase/response regulator)